MSPEKEHEAAHASHEFKIVVNAREKTVTKDRLTFDDVVILAYGPPNYETNIYTITYRHGPESNPQGRLVQGETVKIKSGMIFNVVRTDKS